MSEVRVRFAPSPTGYLHIGGARTALFNYLFAKHNKGKFILRIEDTDTERTIEDSAEKLMAVFRWFGLMWDEGPIVGGPKGPYYQSQRQHLYKAYADKLIDEGLAYKCYCTPQELAAQREQAKIEKRASRYSGKCRHLSAKEIQELIDQGRKPTIRLRSPASGHTTVHDLVRGDVTFQNEEIADFVLMKSDGLPTYNFACVIDDWLMEVSHVIRADEHLSNTPKQIWIYEALGAPLPQFAHVPMILAPDRSKLSKRHGAQTVEEFMDAGYLPEAILNYLVGLGWTPPDAKEEIMTVSEMAALFDLSRVSSTAAIYDVTKMTWMNGHYLRTKSLSELEELYIPVAHAAGLGTVEALKARSLWIQKIMAALQERARTVDELVDASKIFFVPPEGYDRAGSQKLFTKPNVDILLEKGAETLSSVTRWMLEEIEDAYRSLIAREGIKGGDIIHPTRLALTGKTVGPSLFDIIEILGKEESTRRLRAAAAYVKEIAASARKEGN